VAPKRRNAKPGATRLSSQPPKPPATSLASKRNTWPNSKKEASIRSGGNPKPKPPNGTARVSKRNGSPQFTAPTSPRRKVFEALAGHWVMRSFWKVSRRAADVGSAPDPLGRPKKVSEKEGD
jgi:hypothetical protein